MPELNSSISSTLNGVVLQKSFMSRCLRLICKRRHHFDTDENSKRHDVKKKFEMTKKNSKWQQKNVREILHAIYIKRVVNIIVFCWRRISKQFAIFSIDWVVILCINNLNTKTRFNALFCKIIKPIDMTGLKKLLINRNNWSYT